MPLCYLVAYLPARCSAAMLIHCCVAVRLCRSVTRLPACSCSLYCADTLLCASAVLLCCCAVLLSYSLACHSLACLPACYCAAGVHTCDQRCCWPVGSRSCWSVCQSSFESWNMDQLFQSVQHGSTDERLLSTVVQEDRAFYPSRSVVQDGRTLEHECSPSVILAWDDSGGEEEDRRHHR